MSNTFKHVEQAKLRKEHRDSPQERWHESVSNQEQSYYGPKRASDLKIDLYSWDCAVVLRKPTGNNKLRRIRRGARRAMRVALQQHREELPDYKLPVPYLA